ncbi:MAG: carbohydrate kinase family protein [Eubacteriales bacterium]
MDSPVFDAISIGACNVDMIAFVSKFPEAEEKINAMEYVPPHSTGVAMDCISQLTKLGLKCGHFSKIGDDDHGVLVLKELNKDDIDTSRIAVIPGATTCIAWLMVNHVTGERCHIMIPMKKNKIETEDIQTNADYILSARLVHMELLQMPIAGMLEAAVLCSKNGVKVSFDLDIAPKYAYEYGYATESELKNLISHTDILKACKNAARDFCGHSNYEQAAKEMLVMGPKVVIITVGEEGCAVAYKKDDGSPGAFISKGFSGGRIVDTTGAGDAFQGGFLYGVLKGWEYEKCAQLANAIGYLKSKKVGARNSISFQAAEKFMIEQGWKSMV